jgi:hypothetical protein
MVLQSGKTLASRILVRQRKCVERISTTAASAFENNQLQSHLRFHSSSLSIEKSSSQSQSSSGYLHANASQENIIEKSGSRGLGPSTHPSSRHVKRRLTTKPADMERFTKEILQKHSMKRLINSPQSIHDIKSCVKYWTKTKTRKGMEIGRQILSLLLDEIKEMESPNEHLRDDIAFFLEYYVMQIKTFVRPKEFESVILDLLHYLERQRTNGRPNAIKPTLKIYNMAMGAIMKSRSRCPKDTIKDIEDMLERMEIDSIYPDATSYNTLLSAISRLHQKGPETCEALLRKLQNNPNTRNHLDVISYNIVMNAWSKKSDYAWEERNIQHAACRAEHLLHEMQHEYSKGHERLKPSLVSFTTVIDAWSRISSKDVEAAQRAEDILNLLYEFSEIDIDLRPNAFTFHAVMNAWSKSSLPNSASAVHTLLNRMVDGFQAGNESLKPGKISFSIAIKAWARRDEKGNSTQALLLLEQMKLLSDKGYSTAPDIGTFNSVLRAIANDYELADKPSHMENINKQIEALNLRPDLITYNTILRCCATTTSNDVKIKQKAVRIATETLLKIEKTGHLMPDPYTFNFFMKVCDRHTTGDNKLKLVKIAFQYCKESGQFSAPVLSSMKNALRPQELLSILHVNDSQALQSLTIYDFPKEWRSGLNNTSSDRRRKP